MQIVPDRDVFIRIATDKDVFIRIETDRYAGAFDGHIKHVTLWIPQDALNVRSQFSVAPTKYIARMTAALWLIAQSNTSCASPPSSPTKYSGKTVKYFERYGCNDQPWSPVKRCSLMDLIQNFTLTFTSPRMETSTMSAMISDFCHVSFPVQRWP